MKILVKGAGVAGLAVAHELAVRGACVTVVERNDGIGGNASWLAAGMLAPWCERESADDAVLELGRNAADWWDAALPGHVQRNGTLVVALPRDAGELKRFASRTSGHRQVRDTEIAELEPDLAERFHHGLHFPLEAHLDPRRAMSSLHDSLERRGARFHFGTDGNEFPDFDRVVDCTGLAKIDKRLRGVRGEMLILRTPEITQSRSIRVLHPRFPLYIVPRGDGLFMVGATMIESSAAGPATARSVMELLNTAYCLHPAFGEAEIIECGAGVRPAYPDNLPRVEQHGETIFVNGLYRHGFLLSPAMARRAADLVLDQHLKTEVCRETDNQRPGA